MLTVVKVGGSWMDRGETSEGIRHLLSLEGQVVVVHGGGKEISRWYERAGLPVEWADGLRVTRGDGLQLSAMVLSGWMNKRLVSLLAGGGRRAVGISGEDGGLFKASGMDEARYGAVGRIRSVDVRPVRALLQEDFLPVVSPVSIGPDGPLNVNADEAAVALAMALEADRLFLISDVPGVMEDGEVLPELDAEAGVRLRESGVVKGGMEVKVFEGLRAASRGVEVRIGSEELLDGAPGTRLVSLAFQEAEEAEEREELQPAGVGA